MARIVFGMGTSHGPQLSMGPEHWPRRAAADRRNPELWFQGRPYAFPELLEARSAGHFEREMAPEKADARFAACQRAIATLAERLDRVAPDVAVIVGDDQHESFVDDNMPAICIYWGETVDNAAIDRVSRPDDSGLAAADWGNNPPEQLTHHTEPELGRHIVETLIRSDFEPSHSRKLPAHRHGGGIGHAFGFVYRRIMKDEVIPNVPILLNTYYPPNQPSLARCYRLGQVVRQAIESWENDKTVALIGSGGLSHFVIEEDLDRQIIDGLQTKDGDKLTSLPAERFNSGTSEIRNWIVVAGAMADGDLGMDLIDYVPCYRSEAGTGCAMAFATWQ